MFLHKQNCLRRVHIVQLIWWAFQELLQHETLRGTFAIKVFMWSSHHVQWGDPWKNLVPALCASHSFSLDTKWQQSLSLVSVMEESKVGYGKMKSFLVGSIIRAVVFWGFPRVSYTDMECSVAVPSSIARFGHASIYQRDHELHARVTVNFWEGD